MHTVKLVPVMLGVGREGGLFWLRLDTSRLSMAVDGDQSEQSAPSGLSRVRWLCQPGITSLFVLEAVRGGLHRAWKQGRARSEL